MIYKINKNNKEKRRGGTTCTGVSQKDLQINENPQEKKTPKSYLKNIVGIASMYWGQREVGEQLGFN